MNPPKCDSLDYIHFLIAAQKVFTCTEAARRQPQAEDAPAHDAFTRLLQRQPPDTEALGQEAKALVDLKRGLLVLDGTTLDKPYAKRMDLVTYRWSGKRQRGVKGINLQTPLWTDGHALIPCDLRVRDAPSGGRTKDEHFLEMLKRAKERGFEPEHVLMDSWYSSLENPKFVARRGWFSLTRPKSNRLVNPDGKGNAPIIVNIPPEGRAVHLRGFGWVKVLKKVSGDGGLEYFATDDLQVAEGRRADLEGQGWGMGVYHRGLGRCCGAGKAQVMLSRQGNIGGKAASILKGLLLCLRAFSRLEADRLRTGVSWYEAKLSIIRDAIRPYLAHPAYTLPSTA